MPANAYSEQAAVRAYLILMREIAIRIDLVARACDGRLNLSPPFAMEYCYLHFRRICELLALGCLQLHGDLPEAQSKSAKKEWNAERIMKLLQRSHPHSFPQSLTRTKVGDTWKLEANSKPGALTLAEFNALYSKCGAVLHRGTIRSIETEAPIGRSELDEMIKWPRKLIDLLDEHLIARSGGKGAYHISMKTDNGGPVCSVFSEFIDGSVLVATFDLSVESSH